MKFTNSLIKGKLIKRYKRFFVDIKVNNSMVTAHCPNTGSMMGLLEEGNNVLISKQDNPKRKLKFTLEMIEVNKKIAYVSQDVVLFNDTVRNNIAYGELKDTSDGIVSAAAEAACATEFINKMPEGMATIIGEDGARLSGGQRQRLAIARALLKDARLLILDEATSSLDSHSERHIQLALENVRKGRTCLIIAHRLSTIENADRIVVLDKGRIVEQGKHKDLLVLNNYYSKLYQSQFRNQEDHT